MTADKEKRRAVSREAARVRRRAESEVFCDLSRLLPVPSSLRSHLDKPSVIRLTISHLRMHTLVTGCVDRQMREMREDRRTGERGETGETELYLRLLEGFVIVVTTEGDMIYLSDNISKHMGLTQVELMGHSIYDFTHPCDHEDIRDNLRPTAVSGRRWQSDGRNFLMRMKSTVTHRGTTTNLKSASWRVLHCRGRVKVCLSSPTLTSLFLTCQPLPLSHTPHQAHTFASQHSMDMRFNHCDQRVTGLLGYLPQELLGRSVYELCHALDSYIVTRSHMNLCSKGQSVSGLYRMLVRGGGYRWVETHSTVVPSPHPFKRNPNPYQAFSVLCVTYVLSGVVDPSLLLSLDQTLCRHVS